MAPEDYIKQAIQQGTAKPGSVAGEAARMQVQAHAARLSAFQGGYTGGQYAERLSMWTPALADANFDLVPNLRELRVRSRDLLRNSPIAAGAAETQVSHVVGSGLMLQSRIDGEALGMDEDAAEEWQQETERRFAVWANSEYADAYGQQNFAELQDLAYRSHFESGDSFVVLASMARKDWPFKLALQVIEADRVCNEQFRADNDRFVQGIERDEQQQPVAVWVLNRHPGAAYSLKGFEWTRMAIRGASGRRNVIHLMRKVRPGQSRGIPALAPIIETLKQLTRYSTAEVDAAVNSASLAVFVKMDPDTFADVFDDASRMDYMNAAKGWDGGLQSGKAVNLLPGEEIQTPALGRPNPNFDPFVQAVMRQIGMALNIPHEVLTKHFQSSYSAARAALLDAWRTFRIRRGWLAAKLCQPVYEEWLADEVAAGRIQAPGFFTDPLVRAAWCGAQWGGDGPGALDPLKEAQAARERMDIGLTTLDEEIVAYDGGDWQTKQRKAAQIKAERVEAGLDVPAMPDPGTPGAPGVPAGPGKAAPQPAEDDGEDDAAAEPKGLRRAQALRRGNVK